MFANGNRNREGAVAIRTLNCGVACQTKIAKKPAMYNTLSDYRRVGQRRRAAGFSARHETVRLTDKQLCQPTGRTTVFRRAAATTLRTSEVALCQPNFPRSHIHSAFICPLAFILSFIRFTNDWTHYCYYISNRQLLPVPIRICILPGTGSLTSSKNSRLDSPETKKKRAFVNFTVTVDSANELV